MKKFLQVLASTGMLLLAVPAWAEIIVEGAWVRMPPPVADTAAGYLTLKNRGDHKVMVTSVECDVAATPEFHSMKVHDGMVHMQKMEEVAVPAGGSLEFAPGGDHLMLKELTRELRAGDHVMLKISTSDGESIAIHAEVRDMRGKVSDQGHQGGHHH